MSREPQHRALRGRVDPWLALAAAGFALLPWYAVEDGFWTLTWVRRFPDPATAPAIWQGFAFGRWWLLPYGLPLLLAGAAVLRPADDRRRAELIIRAGTLGLLWSAIQGFTITHRGWALPALAEMTGTTGPSQPGMGYGALALDLAFLFLITTGLAMRGWCRGDAFITGAIGFVLAATGLFIAFPVA